MVKKCLLGPGCGTSQATDKNGTDDRSIEVLQRRAKVWSLEHDYASAVKSVRCHGARVVFVQVASPAARRRQGLVISATPAAVCPSVPALLRPSVLLVSSAGGAPISPYGTITAIF